ncbi:MAG: hypothetical protein IT326_10305 [Anaerolineae bacterium]|nr:hypothetical protein [Anaerolineae bacterium]
MTTAVEFSIVLENKPGTLAAAAEIFGNAGVNIIGVQDAPCSGEGIMQVLTSDPVTAEAALKKSGVQYTRREVLLLNLVDKPGELARVARAMSNAKVNIEGMYIAMTGQVVFSLNDLAAGEKVAKDSGVL